jgi:hypothetical protein
MVAVMIGYQAYWPPARADRRLLQHAAALIILAASVLLVRGWV